MNSLQTQVEDWFKNNDGFNHKVLLDKYDSSEYFSSYLSEKMYDIVFLDVEMPKMNGMELAREIRSKMPWAIILFLTSHSEFAPDGYRVQALRYITKSRLDADRLLNVSCLHRAHCYSGNDITDAIINCKYSEAQMLGINFRFSANLHQPISIDSVDICGVLANQIDNAFDACKKIRIGGKEVVIDIKQVNEMVFFKVTNTTSDDPFDKNGELKSTKITDAKRHGFGLENMQTIAEKYSGFMQTEYRDGRFISLVMLNNQPLDT